jgi:hypothetical protein
MHTYKHLFGMDNFDDQAKAKLMTQYTGGSVLLERF